MNKTLQILTYLVVLGILSPVVLSLKEGECEGKISKFWKVSTNVSEKYTSYVSFFLYVLCIVCIATVTKFGESLDATTKSNPKLIEAEFKKFCKTSKSKENRFVRK